MQKKMLLAKNQANNKNLQFLPNQIDIKAVISTPEMVILTKFNNNLI